MSDERHYRDRLADEVVARIRRRMPTMLPDKLNQGETYTVLRLVHGAVRSAVDELDQRELWRTD